MKIDIIDVQIEDPSLKADVVFLVDNIEFSQDIQKLRDKWSITPTNDFGKFANYIEYHLDQIQKQNPQNSPVPLTVEHILSDIKLVRRKHGRTIHYDEAIKWVLFTNTVPDGVYKRCYFDKVLLEGEDPDDPKSYHYALIVTPNVTAKEVSALHHELMMYLWGDKKTAALSRKKDQDSKAELSFLHEQNLVPAFSKNDLSATNLAYGVMDDWDDLLNEFVPGAIHSGDNPHDFSIPKELELARRLYYIAHAQEYKGNSAVSLSNEDIIKEIAKQCKYHGNDEMPSNHLCVYCDPYLDSSKVSKLLKLFTKRVSSHF